MLLCKNCIFLEEFSMYAFAFHSLNLFIYHLNLGSLAEKNSEHTAYLTVYILMIHTGHHQDKSRRRFCNYSWGHYC